MTQSAWASTPNYPAGANPWSGAPTKVVPAYTFFTPGITPSAQELNSMFNSRDVAINLVGSTGAEIAAANWSPSQNLGNDPFPHPYSVYAVCYDHLFGQWLAAADSSTPTPKIFVSQDGETWALIQTLAALPNAAVNPRAIAAFPNTGTVMLYGDTGVNGIITRCVQSSAPTSVGTTNNAWAVRGGALANQGVLAYFWGATTPSMYFIGASSNGVRAAWVGFAASDTAANDGVGTAGVWTDNHTSLPASFLTGNSLVRKWEAAQSATQLVIAQCGQTAGTDSSFLLLIAQNGTMSDATPSFVNPTRAIRGIAYSQTDGLWGMLSHDAGGNVYLDVSADLVSWTPALILGSTFAGGLAVIRNTWLMSVSSSLTAFSDKTIYISNVLAVAQQGATPQLRFSSWPYLVHTEQAGIATTVQSNEIPLASAANIRAPQFVSAWVNTNGGVPTTSLLLQSLKSGHVDTQGSGLSSSAAQIGWNTSFDLDFSKLATTSFAVDGPIVLGGYTFTKANSAGDRASLTNGNGTGLSFFPTAGVSGCSIYLPLTSIVPANVLLWPTSLRFFLYVQAQNFAHNLDDITMSINPGVGANWYDLTYAMNGAGKGELVIDVTVPFTSAVTSTSLVMSAAPGASTNVSLMEIPGIDSGIVRALSGSYGSGVFPTETGAIYQVATADAASNAWQDPTSGQIALSGLGFKLQCHANAATAALTVTVGRIRCDYKL